MEVFDSIIPKIFKYLSVQKSVISKTVEWNVRVLDLFLLCFVLVCFELITRVDWWIIIYKT